MLLLATQGLPLPLIQILMLVPMLMPMSMLVWRRRQLLTLALKWMLVVRWLLLPLPLQWRKMSHLGL